MRTSGKFYLRRSSDPDRSGGDGSRYYEYVCPQTASIEGRGRGCCSEWDGFHEMGGGSESQSQMPECWGQAGSLRRARRFCSGRIVFRLARHGVTFSR